MEKSIDYPEGNVKKIDLVYMAGALASVVMRIADCAISGRTSKECRIGRSRKFRYDQTKYGRLRFDRIINNESNLK